ncbi:unnamed protein product [Mytilus edulis]|uniref:Uncharacterized protein n=1 Tax=Mytilus edulis TaxID=6550 RepID=A0A8S3UNW0_MYTED|nr:unnamed protein product [Mytilus edulis]
MASSITQRAKITDSHKKVTELVIGDYTLNVDKTLKKKLEATKRLQHVEYKFTNGGVVITSDAATFELFRMAAMRYYETLPPNHGVAHIKKTTDSTRLHTVRNTVRVVQPSNKSYTVNIYYTTSRLLVNGKNVSDFIDRDLQNIHNIISSSTSNNTKLNIDDLNAMLREQLTSILNANQMKYEEVNSQNTQDKDSDNIACIKCTRNCRTKSTYCSTGNHWVHYRCQNLTQEDITEVEKGENNTYTCTFCTGDSKKLALPSTLQIANCNQLNDLLQEEVTSRTDETTMSNKDLCFVCDQQTDNTPWDVCDLCNNMSHTTCMNIENNEHHCNACIGSEIMEDTASVIKTDRLQINQHNLTEPIEVISEENTSTVVSETTLKTVISSNSPQPKQCVLKKIVLPERITKASANPRRTQLKHSELRERS